MLDENKAVPSKEEMLSNLNSLPKTLESASVAIDLEVVSKFSEELQSDTGSYVADAHSDISSAIDEIERAIKELRIFMGSGGFM